MKMKREDGPPKTGAATFDGKFANKTQDICQEAVATQFRHSGESRNLDKREIAGLRLTDCRSDVSSYQRLANEKFKTKEAEMTTKKKIILALGAILALGMGAVKTAGATDTNPAELDLDVTFNGQLSVTVDGAGYSTDTIQAYSAAATPSGNPGGNEYAAPINTNTIVNDGNVVAKWELDVSTISGGGNWELNNATGSAHTSGTDSVGNEACITDCPSANQYAVQALFVSSMTAVGAYGTTNGCPNLLDPAWDIVADTVPAHAGFTSVQPAGFGLYTASDYVDLDSAGINNGAPNLPDSSISGLTGQSNPGDMLIYGDQAPGTGKRGLCVRVTMPSSTATTTQQTIQLEITAIAG